MLTLTVKGFYTNLSESDIGNIFIDNFHRFVMDFQNSYHLVAGCQPGSWVMAKFFYVTQIEALENNFTHGDLIWEF